MFAQLDTKSVYSFMDSVVDLNTYVKSSHSQEGLPLTRHLKLQDLYTKGENLVMLFLTQLELFWIIQM